MLPRDRKDTHTDIGNTPKEGEKYRAVTVERHAETMETCKRVNWGRINAQTGNIVHALKGIFTSWVQRVSTSPNSPRTEKVKETLT